MDIKIASELLDGMPISRSSYEFKNFNIEQHSTFPRQLRAALLEKEQLTDQLVDLNADVDLINLDTKDAISLGNERGEIIARRNDARINQLRRSIKDVEQRLSQIDEWLAAYSVDECRNAVSEFEQTESDYWTEDIGKRSAIELLALDHVTRETMTMLNQLPLVDYKKAVIITAQLATFLKETAFVAESTVFPQQSNSLPSGDAEQKQAV